MYSHLRAENRSKEFVRVLQLGVFKFAIVVSSLHDLVGRIDCSQQSAEPKVIIVNMEKSTE